MFIASIAEAVLPRNPSKRPKSKHRLKVRPSRKRNAIFLSWVPSRILRFTSLLRLRVWPLPKFKGQAARCWTEAVRTPGHPVFCRILREAERNPERILDRSHFRKLRCRSLFDYHPALLNSVRLADGCGWACMMMFGPPANEQQNKSR
jgi:hypothetical protein